MVSEAGSTTFRLSPELRAKLRRMADRAGVTENDIIHVLLILADEEKVADVCRYLKYDARRRTQK